MYVSHGKYFFNIKSLDTYNIYFFIICLYLFVYRKLHLNILKLNFFLVKIFLDIEKVCKVQQKELDCSKELNFSKIRKKSKGITYKIRYRFPGGVFLPVENINFYN